MHAQRSSTINEIERVGSTTICHSRQHERRSSHQHPTSSSTAVVSIVDITVEQGKNEKVPYREEDEGEILKRY